MWAPWVGHLFHLKRADMADVTLHEFLSMYDQVKG